MTSPALPVSAWLFIVPLQIAFLALVVWLAQRWLGRVRRRVAAGPVAVTGRDGEWTIPVMATFAGVSFMPWWYAVATNSLNPRLTLGPATLSYRVLRRRERRYDEIEQVDVNTAPLNCNLKFRFRGAWLTFSAAVGTPAAAGEALRRLPATVPLSERARILRDAADDQAAGPGSPLAPS